MTVTQTSRAPSKAETSSAFTLVEVLVVIAIIVTLSTVTLLSIPRLLESVNYSATATRVMGALGRAQTAATASSRPTGVAFLYDIKQEQYTLLPLELLNNRAALTKFPTGPVKHVFAQAFKPMVGAAPVELPAGMGVFGLAFNHIDTINQQPERTKIDNLTQHWYAGELFKRDLGGATRVVNPWIFPRNDPRLYFDPATKPTQFNDPWDPGKWDTDAFQAVRHANSFFIQFAADGSVASSFTQGDNNNPQNAYIEYPDLPIDPDFIAKNDEEPVAFDDPAVFDPEFRPSSLASAARAPNPEVVLRTVSELAIVNLQRMGKETGVAAPWLIHPASSLAPWPNRELLLSTGDRTSDPKDKLLDDEVLNISRWIDLNADIVSFNRYTGQAMRR